VTARSPALRRKLMKVILLACGVALLINCVALFAYQYFTLKQAATRNLAMLSEVVAANSTAALAFNNEADARAILGALQAEPQIVAAALYDADGALFARYPSSASDRDLPNSSELSQRVFPNGRLSVFQPVSERDKRLGTLFVTSDMRQLYSATLVYGLIAFLIIVASLSMAYLISARLEKTISRPILALAATATAISERRDYSTRAVQESDDEVGQLTGAFNHMLSRIQSQLGSLDLLRQTTRAIADRHDMPSIFKVVLRSLEESMPIDFGCVCLYEAPADFLTVASIGPHSASIARELELAERLQISIDQNGLSRCVQGTLVYEPDVGQMSFKLPNQLAHAGMRSVVCAPLLVDNTVFGVLIAARREVKGFTSNDCEFLKQLSEHVALASRQMQLHDALQQAYDDLRQSQQTVMQQERLRALGQMASGIAHDINNAISPVTLYTESLLEREPNLSDRARSYLTTIRQSIDDVAKTVARMREFYRNREPQLVLAAVDLNQAAKQVIEMTQARWSAQPQERGIVIELRTEFDEHLPIIMGAEAEIRDALTNLIFNAVDAMPEGGILTVRTRVLGGSHLPHESSGVSVAIEVTDSGAGMDTETRQRCLEPFFTTKGERGTGLGLAMVYGMIQRHSADLEIDSEPGKGTTVRFVFQAALSTHVATVRVPAVLAPNRRLRILIIDDDPLLIKSLRDILEADGHTITAADGGQKGIDAFHAAKKRGALFSLVITDLGMPYIDGMKVAAAIKGEVPSMPVVLLTGWGQRLLAENEQPPNIDRILSKPPRIHELRTLFAEIDSLTTTVPLA
jgi:signal transduction histidine kinase/ActR/RegA family two-component response regulator/HAMP domain-containing protein